MSRQGSHGKRDLDDAEATQDQPSAHAQERQPLKRSRVQDEPIFQFILDDQMEHLVEYLSNPGVDEETREELMNHMYTVVPRPPAFHCTFASRSRHTWTISPEREMVWSHTEPRERVKSFVRRILDFGAITQANQDGAGLLLQEMAAFARSNAPRPCTWEGVSDTLCVAAETSSLDTMDVEVVVTPTVDETLQGWLAVSLSTAITVHEGTSAIDLMRALLQEVVSVGIVVASDQLGRVMATHLAKIEFVDTQVLQEVVNIALTHTEAVQKSTAYTLHINLVMSLWDELVQECTQSAHESISVSKDP